MAEVDQFLDDVREDGIDEAPASWKSLKTRSLVKFVMAAYDEAASQLPAECLGKAKGRGVSVKIRWANYPR
jgi:hypothetical protein